MYVFVSGTSPTLHYCPWGTPAKCGAHLAGAKVDDYAARRSVNAWSSEFITWEAVCNGHPPGTDGPMVTALKGYNGGQVLVFVMCAFAEMPGDVSRICDIIAHELAGTHVSYYSDDAKRTKGIYRKRIQKACQIAGPSFSVI